MSELLQKQWLFMRWLPRLMDKAHEMGFELTEGDGFRDPRVFGEIGVQMGYGHPKSAHKRKLAKDLNLFKDGVFLADTEAHRPLGEWWKAQNPDFRWGGDFPSSDGNHYSIEHEGIK